jgi:L-proline 3-hydroxylase-like protein/aspartyl/asparaginyl beta-hydroxylase
MQSRILGQLRHDADFADDIARILEFTGDNSHYSEFRIGDWKTFVLQNSSGRDDDGLVTEGAAPLVATPRGRSVSGILRWIEETFHTHALKLVRVHSLGDGVLVPHRDFIEINQAVCRWTRIHVPIMTNDLCLHAEEDAVFRMRPGEIWFLDASRLHSATNFSDQRRLNLCLDFELYDAPIESVFKTSVRTDDLPAPELVKREPLDDVFLAGIHALAAMLNLRNYRDAVGLLSKVPFYRNAGLASFFDWLIAISDDARDPILGDKSRAFARFLKAERKMHERFVL